MDFRTYKVKLLISTIGAGLAFFLWHMAFLTNFLGNFWFRMALSVMVLILYATLLEGKEMLDELKSPSLHDLGLGIISALILYMLFFTGFAAMKPILEQGAGLVYRYKFEMAQEFIIITLLFTSFGEEYFWRGFLQRKLCEAFGPSGIIIATVIYGLVHLPTLNITLILAALVAGLYWGTVYFKFRSLWAVIISHIVWTELIFVLLPL